MAQAQKSLLVLALAGHIALLFKCLIAQAVHLQARQRQATLIIGIN